MYPREALIGVSVTVRRIMSPRRGRGQHERTDEYADVKMEPFQKCEKGPGLPWLPGLQMMQT